MRSLVWFRSDLRTLDNTALHHASKSSDQGVIALFVISPGQWRAHDVAPVRVDFMLRSLKVLSDRLAQLRIPLRIVTAPEPADVPRAVLREMQAHRCDALHINREYEVNEAARDVRTTELLRTHNLAVYSWDDQTLLAPGSVRTGEGRPYTVFTPFRKACARIMLEQGVHAHPTPRSNAQMPCEPSPIPAHVPGFESSIPAERWPAGEEHAARMLREFLQRHAEHYHDARNVPSRRATSELSPHLAAGTISVRTCVRAAMDADPSARTLDDFSRGAACWISELLWRDFFVHVMHAFPRVCRHRAFQLATERIEWIDNDEHFRAWTLGRTGVPIVDAGMRQLMQEGWMHNRVRMITAMYLTKNLLIDWRRGEQWFMRNLVDGFLASNNGGWQWSASTGTDAAPYFRVFNPVSQSQRYDPAGEYIRRYVPELRELNDEHVHDPSALAPLARARLDYPPMLVDLSTSRQRAIDAFKAIKARG